ncbi:MAG TPA: hypothetical protein VGD46_13425 [Rhizobacter sp.]
MDPAELSAQIDELELLLPNLSPKSRDFAAGLIHQHRTGEVANYKGKTFHGVKLSAKQRIWVRVLVHQGLGLVPYDPQAKGYRCSGCGGKIDEHEGPKGLCSGCVRKFGRED